MTRTLSLIGSAALLLGAAGCVPQEKYNALKLDRDGLAEQLGKAQTGASTARAEAESYKQQLGAIMNNGTANQGLAANLMSQNADLQAQLADMQRRYNEALQKAGTQSALPPQLANDLTAFAQQNPDLVEFDAARGIVKFKSDVTFAKGDATVQPKAKEAIARFASILNSAGANSYELLVAGHTDNTPVSNPATKAAGHKDNWYLSAHRAITVGEELMSARVSAQRLGVVGYADQRPVAPNTSASGQQQNRRVEVLILPTTVRANSNIAAAPRQSAPAPRQSTPVLNKDTATVNTGPMLNK
jgi:chemotaxis protein MotB